MLAIILRVGARVMFAALCALPPLAHADWPDHAITLIVPFPAGGGVDAIARPFAERLGERLHQPVVVVPRDGAAGTIGTAAMAAAKPDGYTLAFTPNGPLTIQPHVLSNLPYNASDIVPVCQVFTVEYVLAVRPDSPYKTFDDFAKAARAEPGKLSYGYGGVATSPHLAIAQMALVGKLDMLAVPFRGDPQAMLALRGGEIDSAMLNIGGAKAGGFRPLVMFGNARQPDIPDVPTAKELGYPVVSSAFGGVFAPKGTPPDVVHKLESACEAIVADERYRKAVRAAYQDPLFRTGSEFAKVLAADLATKGDVVRRAGIKGP